MRLFVAVEVSEAWRQAAAAWRDELERGLSSAEVEPGASRALRWVQPAALHLTLRFLGEWPEARVPELQGALAAVDWPSPPTIALGAPGFFGRPGRLSVVWLAIEGDRGGLERLASGVESAVVGVGAAPEGTPYRPHLTLARVRQHGTRAQREAIAAAIERVPAERAPPLASTSFEVRSIALVRSHLGPQGPRYEVLSRHSTVHSGGSRGPGDRG